MVATAVGLAAAAGIYPEPELRRPTIRSATDTLEFLPIQQGSMLGDCPAAADTMGTPCRLRRQWTREQLAARIAAEGNVSLRGDTITIAARSPYGGVRVLGGITLPMAHFPGTDLWVVDVRAPRAAEARFSWSLGTDHPLGTWRGPKASAAPRRSTPLKGSIRRDTIASTALGEKREIVTYLPPGYRDAAGNRGADGGGSVRAAAGRANLGLAGAPRRTIVLADGQAVPDFAPLLDAMIVAGSIEPTAIVGITSPSHRVSPMGRTLEYVVGATPDSARFLAHEKFVLDEVLPWARALGIDVRRESLAFMGMSNGGAFAVTMALRHPARIGAVIALSPAGPPLRKPVAASLPPFYMMVGTLEAPLVRTVGITVDNLQKSGARVASVTRVTGHENMAWEEEFPLALAWLKQLR